MIEVKQNATGDRYISKANYLHQPSATKNCRTFKSTYSSPVFYEFFQFGSLSLDSDGLVDAIDTSESIIESNHKIMGGTPVLKGTRIPLYVFEGLREEGFDPQTIIDEIYPHLSLEQVKQMYRYIESKEQKLKNKMFVHYANFN
jgi:uncharacterized protein (DUF433 family)